MSVPNYKYSEAAKKPTLKSLGKQSEADEERASRKAVSFSSADSVLNFVPRAAVKQMPISDFLGLKGAKPKPSKSPECKPVIEPLAVPIHEVLVEPVYEAPEEELPKSEIVEKSAELVKSIDFTFRDEFNKEADDSIVQNQCDGNAVGITDIVNEENEIFPNKNNHISDLPVEAANLAPVCAQGMYSALAVDRAGFVYTADEFRRYETVANMPGDGNCLYRSLLHSVGLDQKEHGRLREAIATWILDNLDTLCAKSSLSMDELTVHASETRKASVWGGQLEIFCFEQMSGLKAIVYELELGQDRNPSYYRCVMGWEREEDLNVNSFAILWCGKVDMSGLNNHYNSIVRSNEFGALVTKFKDEYLPVEKGVDNLPTVKWPDRKPPKGKKKNHPTEYLEEIETDYWNCYRLESINGLQVWSYVKKVNEIDSFYTMDKKNEFLTGENRINFLNTTHKGEESPTFDASWSKEWSKKGNMNFGNDNLIRSMPKNVWFNKNIEVSDLHTRTPIGKSLRSIIPNAVCYTCSGRSNMGYALYKYFPSLNSLIEHSRIHEGGVSKFSCFNLELNIDDWILVAASLKPAVYYLMRRCSIERVLSRVRGQKIALFMENMLGGFTDEMSDPSFTIFGWNARSLFKHENAYMVQKFLTEREPDFLLINESGEFKNRIEKVVPTYKSLHSENRVLAYYKRNISVTPLWTEMWQGHIIVFKVTLKKKSMVLVNAYRPPSDQGATFRIVAIIEALDRRYTGTPVVIFGDLNYRREQLELNFSLLYRRNFKFVYDNDKNQFTRSLETVNGTQKSYLDYFVVKNVSSAVFSIHEPIGNSDHRALCLRIFDESMRIKRVDLKVTSFNKIWKDCAEISDRLLSSLKLPDPVAGLTNLVNELKIKYPQREAKVKSHFKVIEKLKSLNDWEAIRALLKTCNSESFFQFLACFEKLKVSRRDKEYFVRLRFYSELNRDTDILSDLVVEDTYWGTTVSTDKEVINTEVVSKYKKLFKDDAGKVQIAPLDDSVILYTDEIVTEALQRLDLSKAISWDLIPGKSFNIFKNPENIAYLTNALNEIVCSGAIPKEISLGRLFCLNKNASQAGTIDTIRPIVILGVFIKLLEFPLLKVLKTVKLCASQIGFKERMSTEVNIIRLRQVVHDLQYTGYDGKSKMKKRYLLFVDLRTAFDSVDLPLLISKLKEKGVPIPVINTLIKLMNSSEISPDMTKVIAINAGVAQGKLCSPNLFNIYIDDLLIAMNKLCFCSLAFADDTVFVCESKEQLFLVIDELEKWCKANKIEINKKKSGIFVVNDDGSDSDMIKGFPAVTKYKYLGVLLNTKLSPAYHISAIKKKVDAYLTRNRMLHRKYFTPYSLIRIIDYFVKSRISYGLCCFLDSPSAMKRLEDVLARHLKSIFGLPTNTSHRRMLAALGEPEIKMRLAVRLLKNWHKYRENFGIFPMIYEKTLLNYFEKKDLYPSKAGEVDYRQLRSSLINGNIADSSKEFLPCKMRDDHREFLKKFIFSWPDHRNWHLIRYFTNTTKGTNPRLFPKCGCGADNTPDHGANHCKNVLKNRDKILKKFSALFGWGGLEKKDNIFEYLYAVFFSISNVEKRGCVSQLVELMKKTVMELIINDKSIDGREIEAQLETEEKVFVEEEKDAEEEMLIEEEKILAVEKKPDELNDDDESTKADCTILSDDSD